MMHPHTELRFINNEIGYGVVATQFIPKGTITWAHDKLDRTFTPDEFFNMEELYRQILDKYCYRDNQGNFILCWDNGRFVNHSFNSNCISTAYDFEIAVRDIHPGEELTDDYGYLNVMEPFDAVPEPGTTRTQVLPDDLLHYHGEWDAKLRDAFRYFDQVEQPLSCLLTPETWAKANAIARGEAEMESILSCYFDPNREAHAGKPF